MLRCAAQAHAKAAAKAVAKAKAAPRVANRMGNSSATAKGLLARLTNDGIQASVANERLNVAEAAKRAMADNVKREKARLSSMMKLLTTTKKKVIRFVTRWRAAKGAPVARFLSTKESQVENLLHIQHGWVAPPLPQ